MSQRGEDYRARSDSTEPARRHGGSNRHSRSRGEDQESGSVEPIDRPRYEPDTGIIAEDDEQGDVSRSTARHNRHSDQNPQGYVLESASTRRPPAQTTDLSIRPSTTARTPTSQRTLSQPSNFLTLLSSLGIAFVSIPVGEYNKCRRFILSNPDILEHDENLYLREATTAYRSGKIPYARCCIQQALLLRELKDKSSRKRQHFFDLLEDEDEEVLGEFIDAFDRTLEAIRRRVGATAAAVPQQSVGAAPTTYSQALGGTARRPHEDILSPAMSGLTLQSTSDGPRVGEPTFYQEAAAVQNLPDPRQSRHHRGSDGHGNTQSSVLLGNPGVAPRTSRGTAIRGTNGDRETLDPRYTKRGDAKKFFRVGRVFALLWHEPAGSSDQRSQSGRFGEKIYSSIRRMAVVREGHGACWAIPINTYGGSGVAKRGFDQSDIQGHAVIYMTGSSPYTAPREPAMFKTPMRVNPAQDQTLDPMSRINFTKVHTVEHEVKVLNIGTVSHESMPVFEAYWAEQANPPNQ